MPEPSTIRATLLLFRPGNIALTMLGTLLGAYLGKLGGGDFEAWRISMAALISGAIAAGGYALNDAIDVKEDRLNKPLRAVAAGIITQNFAYRSGIILMIAGTGAAFILSPSCGLMASVISILLYSYTVRLKSIGIIGNAVVAFCSAAPLAFGALAAGKIFAGMLAFALAAQLHFAREIIKDVEDMEGDKISGHKTHPIVHNHLKSIKLAGVLMLVLALFIPVPYFASMISVYYLAIAGLTTALPLAFMAGGAIANPRYVNAKKTQRMLKWLMIPGMISIILGMTIN